MTRIHVCQSHVVTRPCLETANPMFVPTALRGDRQSHVCKDQRPSLVTANPIFVPLASQTRTYPLLYVTIFLFILRGFVFLFNKEGFLKKKKKDILKFDQTYMYRDPTLL